MDESDFDGTTVLEKLAVIDEVEAFFAAIDADDFSTARALLKRAQVDREIIAIVMKKMAEADGEH